LTTPLMASRASREQRSHYMAKKGKINEIK
jgi:hypothetical protein